MLKMVKKCNSSDQFEPDDMWGHFNTRDGQMKCTAACTNLHSALHRSLQVYPYLQLHQYLQVHPSLQLRQLVLYQSLETHNVIELCKSANI